MTDINICCCNSATLRELPWYAASFGVRTTETAQEGTIGAVERVRARACNVGGGGRNESTWREKRGDCTSNPATVMKTHVPVAGARPGPIRKCTTPLSTAAVSPGSTTSPSAQTRIISLNTYYRNSTLLLYLRSYLLTFKNMSWEMLPAAVLGASVGIGLAAGCLIGKTGLGDSVAPAAAYQTPFQHYTTT